MLAQDCLPAACNHSIAHVCPKVHKKISIRTDRKLKISGKHLPQVIKFAIMAGKYINMGRHTHLRAGGGDL